MKLYVMRHAWAGPTLTDPKKERERPLLPEGRATALAMAKAMDAAGEVPKNIFCSPYRRTMDTADIVGKYFELRVNSVGDFAPDRPLEPSLANIVGWEETKRALIVVHVDNSTPAFEYLADDKNDDWPDLVMAEVRRVEIDRDTLAWDIKWGLKPSDIGLKDHKK